MWKSPAAACVVLCLGCAPAETQNLAAEPTPESSTSMPMNARLIIKFKDSVREPSTAAFVSKLSEDAGTTLTYLRPMSVGGHVFECRGIYSPEELKKVVERLTRRKDVIYVEEDRMMRHQTPQ